MTDPAPAPIVVDPTPETEQAAALLRQVLLGAGAVLGVIGLAKYTGALDHLAAIAQPLVAGMSGAIGLAALIWGQLRTRFVSQTRTAMAAQLPDEVAQIKGSAAGPVEPVEPVQKVAAPLAAVAGAGKLSTAIAGLYPGPPPVPGLLIRYLERVEGERSAAYQDSRGRWTIGVGHTGSDVGLGVVWSQAQINAALKADLQTAVTRLQAAIGLPAIWGLTGTQYAALLSFVFNVGEVSTWEVWGDIRAGDLTDVPAQLERFVYSDGVRVQGLINRRADDVALWNGTAPEAKLAG
jgi:lysozyme